METTSRTERTLKEGRVGFRIDEEMSGEHEFEPGCGPKGKFPFEFRAKWGPRDVASWLTPWAEDFLRAADLEGTVTAGGLCENAPCKGTIELRYFKDNKIRYAFDFAAGGKQYHFVGDKVNIKPWNLPVSHTTCFGVLTEADTGKLVSRSVIFFRVTALPRFLASFRLV